MYIKIGRLRHSKDKSATTRKDREYLQVRLAASGTFSVFQWHHKQQQGHPLRRMNLISLRVANTVATENISEPRRGVGSRKLVRRLFCMEKRVEAFERRDGRGRRLALRSTRMFVNALE